MDIVVNRDVATETSTGSRVTVNGAPFCYGLEPAAVNPVLEGHPCIPAGTYPFTLCWSARHNCVMPHVENVPGRTAIEIHWGNYPQDTEGCLLVGAQRGADTVLSSRVTFNRLWALMLAALPGGALPAPLDPAAYTQALGTITYVDAATPAVDDTAAAQ